MKKMITYFCSLFLILSIVGCVSTIPSSKDVLQSLNFSYDGYSIELLDSSDDCYIIKVKKGE